MTSGGPFFHSPMTYVPRLKPRAHQVEALEKMRDKSAFALLMEMGTGKSKVIVDEWGASEAEDLLIVAPAGAYRNWWRYDENDQGEFYKHAPEALAEETCVQPWISGAGKNHKAAIEEMLAYEGRRVFVVNVEALSSVKAAREACEEFLRPRRRECFMVVDESTTIKGHSTARTKTCFQLGERADVRRILTGLVAPRDPLDLWAQFNFLDWRILGSRSFYGFRARHAVMRPFLIGGRTVKLVVGFRDVDRLQEKIAPWSYRKTKAECLDLPPVTDLRRDVEMTDEQRRVYKELARNATAELDGGSHVTATVVIAQLLRLDQVLAGHVVDEEGREHDIPENRTRAVLDLLGEHSGKAIIWTAWDPSLRKLKAAIEREFGSESVACFWGGNRSTRGEDEARFKSDPRCRFMVATPGAGGMGNTWVVADLAINHSYTWDLEDWEQSRARNHRDGSTSSVTYVSLVTPGTNDERKLANLQAKRTVAAVIQGDSDVRGWFAAP